MPRSHRSTPAKAGPSRNAQGPDDGSAPPLLDPKLDVVFKMMFVREQSRELLVSLLTAVLRPESPIVEVTVQNPQIPRAELASKDIFLDLVVRLGDGSLVDVEMQSQSRTGAMARALYYWARLASTELRPGEPYGQLRRVVVVLLLGYRAFASTPFHGVFHVLERASGTRLSDRFEIHSVELPKLADLGAEERSAEQSLALWASFFNARERHELAELATMEPIMQRAKSILEELSGEPSAQEAARQREIGLFNWNHSMVLSREEGREQGREEGREALARAIASILEARGIDLEEAQRKQLDACRDLAKLELWLRRAACAEAAGELFED